MSVSPATVLAATLLPLSAAPLGAAVAVLRRPGHRVRSGLQHFAAGVVFAAVGLELLPSVVRDHATIPTITGFAAGVGAMLGLKQLSERAGVQPDARQPLPAGLIATIGIDLAVDGILLGIGFAAGAETGVLLTIALALEVLSVMLAFTTTLVEARSGRLQSVLIAAGLGLALPVAALAAVAVFGDQRGTVLDIVLAFGSAALLYLVTEELLTEAHEVPETPVTTAMFFAGFLVFLVMDLLSTPIN